MLHFFTGLERLADGTPAAAVPEAHFVKAFNCVGNAQMVNPDLPGGGRRCSSAATTRPPRPKSPACSTTSAGRPRTWAGAAARAIEPLCMLWCIPGFRQNEWGHAFKLLRA